ncbi:flagellar hook-basal body complex protein FliE [uncultured Hyphomicrobium sp.]|uniref:flagellar hook-basal body complex protein FliE n=1 Tax=uncultured Hyphomicrobium sp. TaxID=194373 RepID=UPI0025FA5515|nr:flagellar hook-basal body complex protein FliE [uncultured Hyphomicrobium sp.]
MLDGVNKVSPYGSVGGVGGADALSQPAPVTSTPNALRTEPLPTDFGTVLGRMTLEAISTLKQGEQTAIAGVRGQATTQQVVEAVMASEQTLQASIAIRDKVVSAYLEISRMSI